MLGALQHAAAADQENPIGGRVVQLKGPSGKVWKYHLRENREPTEQELHAMGMDVLDREYESGIAAKRKDVLEANQPLHDFLSSWQQPPRQQAPPLPPQEPKVRTAADQFREILPGREEFAQQAGRAGAARLQSLREQLMGASTPESAGPATPPAKGTPAWILEQVARKFPQLDGSQRLLAFEYARSTGADLAKVTKLIASRGWDEMHQFVGADVLNQPAENLELAKRIAGLPFSVPELLAGKPGGQVRTVSGEKMPYDNALHLALMRTGLADVKTLAQTATAFGLGAQQTPYGLPQLDALTQLEADVADQVGYGKNNVSAALQAPAAVFQLFPHLLREGVAGAMGMERGQVTENVLQGEDLGAEVGRAGDVAFGFGKYFTPGGAASIAADASHVAGRTSQVGAGEAIGEAAQGLAAAMNVFEKGIDVPERVARGLNLGLTLLTGPHVIESIGRRKSFEQGVIEISKGLGVRYGEARQIAKAFRAVADGDFGERDFLGPIKDRTGLEPNVELGPRAFRESGVVTQDKTGARFGYRYDDPDPFRNSSAADAARANLQATLGRAAEGAKAVTPEDQDAFLSLVDAAGSVWARETARPIEDWYRLFDVKFGGDQAAAIEAVKARTGEQLFQAAVPKEAPSQLHPETRDVGSDFFDIQKIKTNAARSEKVAKLSDTKLDVTRNPRLVFENPDGTMWVLGRGKKVDDWIEEQMRNLTPEQRDQYRFWYERQLPGFLERGYDPKHLAADALANQNVSTDIARAHMFKAEDVQAGLNNPGRSGLAHDRVHAALQGEPISVTEGAKIPDFVQSNFLDRTRAFTGKDQGFVVVDLHTATDVGGLVSPVILKKLVEHWSGGRLNGKPITRMRVVREAVVNGKTLPAEVMVSLEGGKPVRIRADFAGDVGPLPYEKIAERGRRWTQEINKRGALGSSVEPFREHQLQALGWMNTLRRRGEPAQAPDWTWTRNTATTPFEVDYGRGVKFPRSYPALRSLDPQVAERITFDVTSAAAKDLEGIIGGSLRVQNVATGRGLWEGEWSPNAIVVATGSRLTRSLLADSLSLVGEQAGVFTIEFDRGNRRALMLRTPDGKALPDNLFKEFADAHPDLVTGATRIPDAWILADLTPKKSAIIDEAFTDWAISKGIEARTKEIRHAGRYEEHDWAADPTGSSYQGRISDGGGSRLVRDVVAYRRAYAEHLEDAFGRHAPDALDPAGRTDRVESVLFQDGAAQVAGETVKGMVEFGLDGRAAITLFEAADFSTLSHEFAHVLRRHMPLRGRAKASVERWARATEGWDRGAEEKWARAFERYVREGKAPTAELGAVFEYGRQRLLETYKQIKGSPIEVKLTPGVRKVFDRMLGQEPPVKALKGGSKELPEPKHEFSSTQVNLPPADARKVSEMAKRIPDDVLTEDGRETNPHVTVKYGLHGDDAEAVANLLRHEPPIEVKLGKTSLFENPEGDVVKIDVDSPDLHRLNAKIADLPHTDTYPDYKPHVTLAYVKPGEGAKFAGMTDLEGHTMTIDRVVFSDRNGNTTEIRLEGKKRTITDQQRQDPFLGEKSRIRDFQAIAEELGIEAPPAHVESWEQWMQEAELLRQKGDIVETLKDKRASKQVLSPAERAAAKMEAIDLRQAMREVQDKMKAAADARDEIVLKELEDQYSAMRHRMTDLAGAAMDLGSESGRALAAHRMVISEVYDTYHGDVLAMQERMLRHAEQTARRALTEGERSNVVQGIEDLASAEDMAVKWRKDRYKAAKTQVEKQLEKIGRTKIKLSDLEGC